MFKTNKFHAKAVEYHGIKFASLKERNRFKELEMLNETGIIANLEAHPVFMLNGANGQPLRGENGRQLRYTADFRYVDVATGKTVVEDVKSRATKTQVYSMRKALVQNQYGIKIVEV